MGDFMETPSWGCLGALSPSSASVFSFSACNAGGSGGFDGDAELGLSVPRGGGGRARQQISVEKTNDKAAGVPKK